MKKIAFAFVALFFATLSYAPVSYTHLDVYKRQILLRLLAQANCGRRTARSRRATLLAAAKLDHALAFGKRSE